MKKQIVTDKAPSAIGPYSQGTANGQLVFVSGQLPADPATGAIPATVEEQALQSLTNVKNIVEAAGMTMADVVRVGVFLQDMEHFGAMNAVYGEFFTGDCPARAAVQVARLPKDALVEIEAVACKG